MFAWFRKIFGERVIHIKVDVNVSPIQIHTTNQGNSTGQAYQCNGSQATANNQGGRGIINLDAKLSDDDKLADLDAKFKTIKGPTGNFGEER